MRAARAIAPNRIWRTRLLNSENHSPELKMYPLNGCSLAVGTSPIRATHASP
jgi:hypothetical protein